MSVFIVNPENGQGRLFLNDRPKHWHVALDGNGVLDLVQFRNVGSFMALLDDRSGFIAVFKDAHSKQWYRGSVALSNVSSMGATLIGNGPPDPIERPAGY